MGTIFWNLAFLLPSIIRSLDRHLWHWWSDDHSWDEVDASASKWSAMALGLNIRQPPAGFWLIPTYQPQHRLSLMRFIDLIMRNYLTQIELWYFYPSYSLASWFLLSWQKSWVPCLRVRDQDDHVKMWGATVTTCQEAVVSCQWLSLRVSTSAAAHPAQEAGAHFFCFSWGLRRRRAI